MFLERKIWNDGAPFEDFMGSDGAPPVARRHLAYGGGKGGSGGTTYQTQKTEIPPEVRARYDAVNARAEQVAQQPFQPYSGQFVAPLTSTQQQGIGQIAQAGQSYQPYQQAATTALTGAAEAGLPFYGQAAGNISQAQGAGQPYTGLATQAGLAGTQAITPQDLNINAYQNPYINSVVAPAMEALRQQQQTEQSQLMGQQAMRGAFGGDRGSIAAANLARQQGLAAAQTEAGLRSQAFQQAQQTGLGVAQSNRAALQQFAPQALAIGQQAFQQPMAAAQAQQQLGQGLLGYGQNVAQGLAGLGQQGAQTNLATGQALLGAGTLEQQTQQQLNSAVYNQYLQQQGYPFQVAQFLANIALGTGPLYGSTTTGVTGQPTPFFSDERVKEDITEIGRTHDGQKIIKFKYKGSNQPQIGLSAQDVEKHHPEAVSETPEGIKAVDYDAATKHAERAYGGGLLPSSEGGAVHPGLAGLGFAAGGTPGVDPYSQELLQQLANPMSGTTSHGSYGSMPGKSMGWKPGLAVKPQAPLGSGVSLQRPAPVQTGLSQALGAVKGGLGAVEDAEKLKKYGESAYDWIRGQMPYNGGTETGRATYGSAAPDPAADNPMGPRARGGRAGYALDGAVEDDPTPAIPGGGDDTVLGKLVAQPMAAAKLDTPKLNMGDGAGAGAGQQKDKTASTAMKLAGLGASFIPGVGPAIGAGMNILSGLFARGGAIDADTMADAKRRIAGIESGGNYAALGPAVGGDRAHGKYQVMGRNIPSWTEEALGRRMTPEEFLKSPEAQERVFEHHFGKYLGQHGNLGDAASMWHSGRPLAEARARGLRDVNMSTEDYVRKIMGGAPPAETHMRREPSRSAGLAPRVADVEDLNAGLAPVDTGEDFEMPDRFNQFASGGLVPRHGYDKGGTPTGNSGETVFPPDQSQGVPPSRDATTAEIIAADELARRRGPAPAPARTSTPAPAPTGLVTPPSVNDPNRITTTPLPPPTGVPPKQPEDRDFLDRAGDWYGRNQNWLLPLVSGIGTMLASPSPYLGAAIGQGAARGAQDLLGANFKQQGLDINMMDRLGKQVGVLASDIALRGGPGMAPELDKAQQAAMTRYYRLSGIDYTPTLMDPAKAREQLASSPFAKLRFADNPDLLYRASTVPGLPPEQKQHFLAQASEAARRLADQGYGLDDNGVPVQFNNLNELLRNSLYGKAVASTAGATAGAGVPGGPAFIANTEANLRIAQNDYTRALAAANNNTQDPKVLDAQRRVLELQQDLRKAMSPVVGRAYGGRAGYATDGAVDDMTDVQPMEDNVQLAQATPSPTVPTMPTMPKPPSQAPAPAPRAPVEPSGAGMPGGNPQTSADYRRMYQTQVGIAPKEVTDMYLRRAEELEREAVGFGKQSTGTGVAVAPGAVATKNTLDNATYNTKWLQEQTERQQDRSTIQTGLDVLTDALTHVNTNPLAPFNAKVSEYARSLGFNVGTASERAAAVQEIAKQVAQQAQSAGTDLGRIMSTEGSVEAIKNPMANRAIMAQAYAKLDHDRARYEFFKRRLKDDQGADPAALQAEFEWDTPREKLYTARYNELALPGATPFTESGQPDWNALKPGARYYFSPDDVWRMTGKRPAAPIYMRVLTQAGKMKLREE